MYPLKIDAEAAVSYWGNNNPPLELTAAFTRHRVAVVGLITDWLINARFMNVTAAEIDTRFGSTPEKGLRMVPAKQAFDGVTLIASALRQSSPFEEDGTHDYTQEAKVIVEALAARGLEVRKIGEKAGE